MKTQSIMIIMTAMTIMTDDRINNHDDNTKKKKTYLPKCTNLLAKVGNLIDPQAASRRNGAVEEARIQEWLVKVTSLLVVCLASESTPEAIIFTAFSHFLIKHGSFIFLSILYIYII